MLLIFAGLWASFSFSQQLNPLILTIDEPQIGDSVSQLQIINPNPNDTYVYSFGTDSAVNATFELDSLTGVFWIKNNTWMDADLHSQINFGVSAKVLGSGIYTFNALVTINLIDIQEPIFTGFGMALNYNGANTFVAGTYNNLPQGNAPRTLEAWVNTTSNNSMVVFNYGVTSNNQRSCIFMDNGRVAHIGEFNDSWGSIVINDGNWHHVAFTFDGVTINQYIDGVLDYSQPNIYNTNGFDLNIGRRINQNGEWFDGNIDEVVIWNRALSQQEILQRQNQRPDVTDPNLVVYFPFEETTNTASTLEKKSQTQASKFGFTQNTTINSAITNNVYYIDKSYTTADTIGSAFAIDSDGSNISFLLLSGGTSLFNMANSTGKITVKTGVTLDTASQTSYLLTYEATESGDNQKDTGFIQIFITDTITFSDTTISVGQLHEKGRLILEKSINIPSINTYFSYQIISGNNHQVFFYNEANQSLFVEKSDSLLFALNPTRFLEIEATNNTTGKKDTALITINVLNAGAPVYAGFGNALNHTGNDIVFENGAAFPQEISFSAWVNTNSIHLFNLAGIRFDNYGGYGFTANNIDFYDNWIDENEWTHVAFTRNSQNLITVYKNAKVFATSTNPVGNSSFSSLFSKLQDEITVWKKTLTPNEIKKLYFGKINAQDTTLILWVNANQHTSVDSVFDFSPRNIKSRVDWGGSWGNFTPSFSLNLNISEKQNITDTLFYLTGFQPNGLPLQYAGVSKHFQKLTINALTGGVTLKHPDSLQYPRDSSLTLVYQVTETAFGGTDTAQINLQVLPQFSINTDTVSFNQNPLLGYQPIQVSLKNSQPLSTYQYQIKSGNPNNSFSIDSLGKITVINSTDLTNALNPFINLEIKVTEWPSGIADSAIIGLQILANQSIVFAGWGNYLKLADANTLKFPSSSIQQSTPNRTLSYWVEASENGFFYMLLDGFFVLKHDFYWFNPQIGFGNIIPISDVLPANGPIHYTVVVTPNKTEIYKNGNFLIDLPYSEYHLSNDNPNFNNALRFEPGQFSTVNKNDYIAFDDIAVWKKALTQDEIQQVYKLGIDVTDTNLVRYYPMNQIDVNNLVLDYTGNNLHAQIYGEESNNYYSYLDTFYTTLSTTDTHYVIGYANAWETTNNNINFNLIGSNAADFQINADNSITLKPNHTLPNDTSFITLSYVATHILSNGTDTFSYNLTILPATEAIDTIISMPEDTFLGAKILEDVLINKNPNINYTYEIIGATTPNVFGINANLGYLELIDRDQINAAQTPQNQLQIKVTNNLGFIDTSLVTITYQDKPNKVFAGLGNSAQLIRGTHDAEVKIYRDSALINTSFTIEFLAKTNTLQYPNNNHLLRTLDNSIRVSVYENITNNKTDLNFSLAGKSDNVNIQIDSLFHHYAFVKDLENNRLVIYFDGDEIYNQPDFTTNFSTQELRLGYNQSHPGSGPRLDEFRIWLEAKSKNEINQLKFNNTQSNQSNLWLYLNFNQFNEDIYLNNLTQNPIRIVREFPEDEIYFSFDRSIQDSILQSISANDTVFYATASSLFNHSKFQYNKLPGNTDFQYFDLNDTSGAITISPKTDFSGITGTFELKYLATDITEPNSFDTGSVLIHIAQTPTQLAATNFIINENLPIGDTIGYRRVLNPDSNSVYRYQIIGGNIGNTFSIDSLNSTITVSNNDSLDFERYPIFTLMIQAIGTDTSASPDSVIFIDTAQISINLNNLIEPVFAGFGSGLNLSANNDYIEVLNLPASPVNITQSVWIKTTQATPLQMPVLTKRQNAISDSWPTVGFTQNNAAFIIDGSGNIEIINGPKVNDGHWHLITGVKQANVYSLYVDGVFAASHTSNFPINSTSPYRIGFHQAWGRNFDGIVDEVAVWKTALDSSAIAQIFEGKINYRDTNLLFAYDFDLNASPTQATDISKAANNGVFVNLNQSNYTDGANVTLLVSENAPTADTVGKLFAFDIDYNTVYFSPVGGSGFGRFNIDSLTGWITVADSANLDYETDSTFVLEYRVLETGDNQFDTGFVEIKLINSIDPYPTDLAITYAAPLYPITPKSQFTGLQVVLKNTDTVSFNQNLFVVAQIDSFSNTISLQNMLAQSDTTLYFDFSGVISTGSKQFSVHLSTDTFDLNPLNDTILGSLIITDSLLSRSLIPDTLYSSIYLNQSNPNQVGVDTNTFFGVLFHIPVGDTLTGVQLYFEGLGISDSFKVEVLQYKNQTDSLIETKNILFTDTTSGFKSLPLNCFNWLKPGNYLVAVTQTNSQNNLARLATSAAQFDSLANFIKTDSGWVNLKADSSEFKAHPLINLVFSNRSKYPNVILPNTTDTFICAGDSLVFQTAFESYTTWNFNKQTNFDTITTGGIFTAQAHLPEGCFYTDSVFVHYQTLPNFSFVNDTSVCFRDSVTFNFNEVFDIIWQDSTSQKNRIFGGTQTIWATVLDSLGCYVTDTFKLNTMPLPIINMQAVGPFCANQPDFDIPDSTYSPLGGTFGGTALVQTDTLLINQLPADSIYLLQYSFTDSNNCTAIDTVSFFVKPIPLFTVGTNQVAICEYDTINLFNQVNPTIQNFIWQFNDTLVTDSSYYPSQPQSDSIYFVVTDTSGVLTCYDSTLIVVDVKERPQISFQLPLSHICIDSSNFVLQGGLPVSNGVYSGLGVVQAGNNYLFYPAVADTGIHQIFYTRTLNYNGLLCTTQTVDTLRVDSLPFVSITTLPNLCEFGDSLTLDSFGVPFNGMFTGTGVFYDTTQNTYNFIPDSALVGPSNTINYTFIDVNGCTNSASQILTIVPKPQVNFNPVSNFCVFGLPFNITQFSPPLITSSGSGQFIGNGIIGSTNFHPDSAGPGIHAIKYVYSDTLGCADSVTQNFVVDTLPHVNLNLNAIKNICFGNNVFDLTQVGQAVPAIGGIYLGKNVSGNFYNPSNQPVGNDTVYLSYIHPVTNCAAVDTAVVTIHALPQVSLNLNTTSICAGNADSLLSGGTSSSVLLDTTFYKGPGIDSSGLFSPTVLGAGVYQIYFVAVDTFGCADSLSQLITVNPQPQPVFNPIPPVCLQDTATINSAGLGGLASFQFINISTGSTNIVNANTGLFTANQVGLDTIKLRVTDNNGCIDSTTQTITVNGLPNASFSNINPICRNSFPITLTQGQPTGGVYLNANKLPVGVNVNPAFLGSGNHQFYYVYTDGNGCRDTAQQTLIVHAPPSISLTAFNSYCDNSLPDTLTQGLPKGGIYTSTAGGIINDSIFDASLVLPGTYTIVYTYTDTNGCDSSLSGSLTVNNLPLPQFLVPTLDMCIDGDSVSIANSVSLPAMPPIGFFTGPGIDSSGTFNPAITGVGSFDIYYTYTDANNCTNTTVSPRSIFVHNLPVVGFNPSSLPQICIGDSSTFEATGGVSYQWNTGHTNSTITVAPLTETWYKVSVTDANNCVNSDSISLFVYNGNYIEAVFDSTATELDTEVELDLLLNDTGNVFVYNIITDPKNGVLNTSENPLLIYTPNEGFRRVDSIAYEICDDFCPHVCDTGLVKIKVFGDPTQFIPSGFSPNGDGINDTWVVPGIELYPNNELIIFNRWGDMVYQVSPYLNNWAGEKGGRLSFGAEKLPDGTYFYVIKLGDGAPDLTGVIEMKTK